MRRQRCFNYVQRPVQCLGKPDKPGMVSAAPHAVMQDPCLLSTVLCVVCRSEMHGLLQTSFFFGYNAVVCFAFFLLLGSVGWRASLLFVRSIYKVRATKAHRASHTGSTCRSSGTRLWQHAFADVSSQANPW